MTPLLIILLAFGFVCFTLATFGVNTNPPRWNLVAAGLAFWILTEILYGVGHIAH